LKICYNFRIIKKYALKYKRTLWIVLAAVFLLVLFLLKTASALKNQENKAVQEVNQNPGLTYDNEIVGNLVNRDTDGDGIPDWEEGLWGTDPTK
jgi:flagellar basal body-associated protein FliL